MLTSLTKAELPKEPRLTIVTDLFTDFGDYREPWRERGLEIHDRKKGTPPFVEISSLLSARGNQTTRAVGSYLKPARFGTAGYGMAWLAHCGKVRLGSVGTARGLGTVRIGKVRHGKVW